MHAMRDGTTGQSVADAQSQTAWFISTGMHIASNQMAEGQTANALWAFGLAMHPVMDITSPVHTDTTTGDPLPWYGPFDPNGDSHLFDEGVDVLNANPEVQQMENIMIRMWYQILTGKPLKCCS